MDTLTITFTIMAWIACGLWGLYAARMNFSGWTVCCGAVPLFMIQLFYYANN